MAILVTRPQPDSETTAAALRAKGFAVLQAPMLRFEPVAFHDDADARYGAIIVSSANAIRAIEAPSYRQPAAGAAAVRGRRTHRAKPPAMPGSAMSSSPTATPRRCAI